MKQILSILATNWIHFLGFYVTTYLSFILFKLLGLEEYNNDWSQLLLLSPITILFLFFMYGLLILLGFYVSISALDILGFAIFKEKVIWVLLVEWILIVLPFIYWAFENQYWLWLTLSLSFSTTQFLRKQQIEKIIRNIVQHQASQLPSNKVLH